MINSFMQISFQVKVYYLKYQCKTSQAFQRTYRIHCMSTMKIVNVGLFFLRFLFLLNLACVIINVYMQLLGVFVHCKYLKLCKYDAL